MMNSTFMKTMAIILAFLLVITAAAVSPVYAQENGSGEIAPDEVKKNNGKTELYFSTNTEILEEYLTYVDSVEDWPSVGITFGGPENPDLTSITLTKEQMKMMYTRTDIPFRLTTELGTVVMSDDALRYLVKKAKKDEVKLVIRCVDLTEKEKKIYGEDAVARRVYFMSGDKVITSLGEFNTVEIEMPLDVHSPSGLDVGRVNSKGKLTDADCTIGGQIGNVRCKMETEYLGTFIISSTGRIAYGQKVTGIQQTTIKASAKSASRAVLVNWSKSKGFGVDGYQIYVSSKKDGTYKKVKTTKEKTYKHTGLKAGEKKYYKVRGYRKFGSDTYYTKWSNVVSAAAS